MNGKDLLVALGLKQMVTDNADPDKVAEAARAAYATDTAIVAVKDPALEAKDAEIAELKTKLATALKAKDEKKDDEDKKEEKAEDSLADKLAALDEDDDEEDEKKKEKAEDADFIQPIGEETISRKQFVRDSLRELRPLIARSTDKGLIAKFNKLTAKANDANKGTTPENSYGVVKVAAATKSAAANDASADYSARLNARAEARSRGEEVK